jgi:hypothetical protein
MATIKEAISQADEEQLSLRDMLLDEGIPNSFIPVVEKVLEEYLEGGRASILNSICSRYFSFLLPNFKPERNIYARVLAAAWASGFGKLTGHKSLVESANIADVGEQTMRDMVAKATQQMNLL